MSIYIYIHVYVYVCMYLYIHTQNIKQSIYIHIHIYTYTFTYRYIYIHLHISIYTCIHICIYMPQGDGPLARRSQKSINQNAGDSPKTTGGDRMSLSSVGDASALRPSPQLSISRRRVTYILTYIIACVPIDMEEGMVKMLDNKLQSHGFPCLRELIA